MLSAGEIYEISGRLECHSERGRMIIDKKDVASLVMTAFEAQKWKERAEKAEAELEGIRARLSGYKDSALSERNGPVSVAHAKDGGDGMLCSYIAMLASLLSLE